jgi:hypothetical protein
MLVALPQPPLLPLPTGSQSHCGFPVALEAGLPAATATASLNHQQPNQSPYLAAPGSDLLPSCNGSWGSYSQGPSQREASVWAVT